MMILSGMKPDGTGVGRLVTCLVAEAERRSAGDVRIVCRQSWKNPLDLFRHGRLADGMAAWRDQRQWQRLLADPAVLTADPLVLIQPQALGTRWCERLVESRSLPTWLYLMDSSFFCLRSYNHIDTEHAACTRCVGGAWQSAAQMGCRPWPIADAATAGMLHRLREWMSTGRVRCLVQNERQAELIRLHCGDSAVIRIVGMWTADLETTPPRRLDPKNSSSPQPKVVFHGASIASKGAHWAVEVARHCPQIKFFFPFKARQLHAPELKLPENAQFAPMTWETGLADEVASASVVLVPSLWSATIEGALIKSIIAARAVAVIDEPTAFSSELPAGLVLRLPGDPCRAANELSAAVAANWQPDRLLRNRWLGDFTHSNQNLLSRLVAACREQRRAA